MFEIFLRLPVKSLMRFKCISKFYNSLIGSNSVFKDVHERHYSRTRPTFLIREWTSVYTAEQNKDGKAKRSVFDKLLMMSSRPDFDRSPRVMCVNGLFCMWNQFVQPVLICNPSTREVRFLPQLNIVSNYVMFSLGFDPVENKYKLLMSAKLGDKKYGLINLAIGLPERNWVFTLGIDESWREINNNTLSFFSVHGEICISGVIYQLNCVISYGLNLIAFDVKDENLRVIQLWNGATHEFLDYHNCMLTEVKGKLGVIVNKELKMDLWILGEDQIWERHIIDFPLLWLKHYPFDRMCFCFRTHHEGEIVLAASISQNRVAKKYLYLCYDVTRKCWREFESEGLPAHWSVGRIYVYTESLFSFPKSPCLSIKPLQILDRFRGIPLRVDGLVSNRRIWD